MKRLLGFLGLVVFANAMGLSGSFAVAADAGAPAADSVKAVLDEQLPKIHSKDSFERLDALSRLQNRLNALRPAGIFPAADDQRRLVQELIKVYSEINGTGDYDQGAKETALDTLTTYGDQEVAKPFILGLLDKCSANERSGILMALGQDHGLGGPDFYAKIESLVQKGLVSPEWRANYLVRADKQRALADIIQSIRTTTNKRVFMHTAGILQVFYRRPEDYRLILRRSKELGFDKRDYSGQSGLSWIDHRLLAEYLKIAAGDDLHLCLEVMGASSVLVAPAAIPVLIQKLGDPDPITRKLAIHPLHLGSYTRLVDQASVRQAMKTALSRETDPAAQVEMQREVEEMESAMEFKRERENSSPHKP